MRDPQIGLIVDPVAIDRVSAELQELALRWLSSAGAPAATPGVFGADPQGVELSTALPVFLARVLEARRRCCALLDAAGAALSRAAGSLDELEHRIVRPGGPG